MIELYYWTTPNGNKIMIFLEEAQIPYRIIPVNISQGEQFKESFLAFSPNNRIPAIIDHEPEDQEGPLSVFESGAILLYLANKVGQFLPLDSRSSIEATQWLMWQVGGLGPMLGQNHHFVIYASENIPYAVNRYVHETARLYGVLNKRLQDREFIVNQYSIVDMACYPWIINHEKQKQNIDDFPNVKRWLEDIAQRPAIIRTYQRAEDIALQMTPTEDSRSRVSLNQVGFQFYVTPEKE